MSEVAVKNYYVYTLAYPDGHVFYVGKGSGSRIAQHEERARQGGQEAIHRVIRQIWNSGEQVVKSKVFETGDENEALRFESALIKALSANESLANIHHSVNPLQVKLESRPGFKKWERIHREGKEIYLDTLFACSFSGVSLTGTRFLFLAEEFGLIKRVVNNRNYYRLSELRSFASWMARVHPDELFTPGLSEQDIETFLKDPSIDEWVG